MGSTRWPAERWDVGNAEAEGMDDSALEAAIEKLVARETAEVRDMASYLDAILARQTYREVLGPLHDAAGASGLVIRHGVVVGSWGDPSAVEMSFSATKTYLGAVAGLAIERALIADVDEPVGGIVGEGVTWRHLLHQTSEWGGALWGVPYWADPQGKQEAGTPLGAPGTVWAYNDVRINVLALELTRRWGRSLEDVCRTELMGPIGSSDTWQWHGYRNSFVDIGDRPVSVVSGGAHWGGGVWASAWDSARFGYLFLRDGHWGGRQVLSREWIELSRSQCPANPSYGLLWWLNRRQDVFPEAPASGMCARGNVGRQLIWIDPDRDLVVVSRWADDVGAFLGRVADAVR